MDSSLNQKDMERVIEALLFTTSNTFWFERNSTQTSFKEGRARVEFDGILKKQDQTKTNVTYNKLQIDWNNLINLSKYWSFIIN